MAVRRISPQEAQALIETEGYLYLDVRSIPEFEAGHPAGAYNVPLAHLGARGMLPNPEFLEVVERNFAKDAKIVVGCKSGGRSLQAASIMASVGYAHVIDQRCGFDGAPGPGGRFEPGWQPCGLPTATQAPADHTYEHLRGAR